MEMSLFRSRAGRARAILALALAAAGVAVIAGSPDGPPPGAAGNRYQAGQRALERVALEPAEATAVRARGLDLAAALGLPTGPRARPGRIVDRFAGQVLDEVVVVDAEGRRLAMVRMQPDGRLASATSIGWRARPGRSIAAARAEARATAAARAANLAVDARRPAMTRDVDGGWRASWARSVAGVPAPGDGVIVTLFADGTLHAVAARERPLADAPASTITREAAMRLVGERLAVLLGAAAADARIEPVRLAWVAPNDTFRAITRGFGLYATPTPPHRSADDAPKGGVHG
jgi:hypothetical protein